MKLLIVEDELETRRGIQEILNGLNDRIDVIHAVSSAETALDWIQSEFPDIIITDIVLPEMTGLDLLERARTIDGYSYKTIIVSGYDNFTYAQRSIHLGAAHYILKPFNSSEFLGIILNLVAIIEEERLLDVRLSRQMEQAHYGTKMMKESILASLCMSKTPLHDPMIHRLRICGLEWLVQSAYSVIALSLSEDKITRVPERELELQCFSIGNIMEDVLKLYPPSAAFRNIHNVWIVISGSTRIEEMIDELFTQTLKLAKIQLHTGVSERMDSFSSIPLAYDQSIQAYKMSSMDGNDRQIWFRDIHPPEDQYSKEHLLEAISSGDHDKIAVQVDAALRTFMFNGILGTKEFSRECFKWVVEIHSDLIQYFGFPSEQVPFSLWESIDLCTTVEKWKETILSYLLNKVEVLMVPNNYSIVDKAKRLLVNIPVKDINLKFMAKELSVHPVWLSQIFKKETGVNFVDYMTDLRIENAKQLLKTTDVKIYEVCQEVGYQDVQYFGKIFKKKVGITPKEYRLGQGI